MELPVRRTLSHVTAVMSGASERRDTSRLVTLFAPLFTRRPRCTPGRVERMNECHQRQRGAVTYNSQAPGREIEIEKLMMLLKITWHNF